MITTNSNLSNSQSQSQSQSTKNSFEVPGVLGLTEIPIAVPVNNVPELYVDLENTGHIYESKKDRNKFILKTFIYFGTLLLSNLISIITFKTITFKNYELFEFFYIINIICLMYCSIIPICYTNVYISSPSKYIHYLLFLESSSYLLGAISYKYNDKLLLTSSSVTGLTVAGLFCYTYITETDFTRYIDYFLGFFMCILFTGLLNIFFNNSLINIFIIGSFCLLFTFFIMIDLQMITAKKHIMYSYSTNDYIFAAISLYLDVINMFLYLLQCLVITDNS